MLIFYLVKLCTISSFQKGMHVPIYYKIGGIENGVLRESYYIMGGGGQQRGGIGAGETVQ